jgi:hypothetical protein
VIEQSPNTRCLFDYCVVPAGSALHIVGCEKRGASELKGITDSVCIYIYTYTHTYIHIYTAN